MIYKWILVLCLFGINALTRNTLENLRKKTTHSMRQSVLKFSKKNMMGKTLPARPGGQPNYFGPEPNFANSPLPIISDGKILPNSGIRKFVNSLPGLSAKNKNNLGQYIPVAIPNKTAFLGSDYYEVALVEYTKQLHSDLGKTRLRGYVQTNTVPPPMDLADAAQYLGPIFIAKKDRPVRLKFSNKLPTGISGNLFLPVDTSIMGAGTGPLGGNENYTQNRAVLHLHGGNTPWISDGTPHQWITPANEITSYAQGVSVEPVPDMFPIPTPYDGTATYYYPNQQSARLMWIHDHTFGITRLNVYAGEMAAYLLTDDTEESLISNGILPNLGGVYRYGIPLIIQDKTFVPPHEQLVLQDPTWNLLTTSGSLWFPHVYMPNQNPNDPTGTNAMGRWDYGPWFWPPVTANAGLVHGPILDPNGSGLLIPGTPNPSLVPEAFMDTPLVNGTPYPYLNVDRKPYRFRILNASNDRYLNLQLYYAESLSVSVIDGGSHYEKPPRVLFKEKQDSFSSSPCDENEDDRAPKAFATVKDGKVTGVTIEDPGIEYKDPPQVFFCGGGERAHGAKAIASLNTEVKMIPACPSDNIPSYYPMMDGRDGGVPDPNGSGPMMIQIGTEGGFLPNPVVLPNTPIGYLYNRRDVTVLNVKEKTLFLGPAERADVIIDFSQVPSNVKNLILYNDAPAPVPGFDPRLDYYTNDPDFTSTGGAPSTIAGYGPNTRTIMQFRLSNKTGEPFNLQALENALPKAYIKTQPAPVIPETTYPLSYHSDTDAYSKIQDNVLTFTPVGSSQPITMSMLPKAIHELFELDYGRMNSVLGAELPLTNFGTQTTVPLEYRDPPTEILANDDVQIWKITHNGVDTHAMHFHLFNVQLINRVGWDGFIKPPDPNEIGWKETVRMNPLEDTIVALHPVAATIPFSVPNSIRPLAPAMALGDTWQSLDPTTGAAITYTNTLFNFGFEYVWHCHLLGHEENDMMRPISFNLIPGAPINVSAIPGPLSGQVTISFSPPSSTGTGGPITLYTVFSTPQDLTSLGLASPITISGLTSGTVYTFQVIATNAQGQGQPSAFSNAVIAP